MTRQENSSAVNRVNLRDNGFALEYSARALPGFESLKYSATMLAGLLVLALADTNKNFRALDLERKALDELARAEDTIGHIVPTEWTAHHHYHLVNALGAIRNTANGLMASADVTKSERLDHAVVQLRFAWEELRHAARNLPGFELIDLSQSCCALHANWLRRFSLQ